jgi:hypothetical protein
VYGPSGIGKDLVWEVWAYSKSEKEWFTRYAILEGNELVYIDSFGSLAQRINGEISRLYTQRLEFYLRVGTLVVAAIAFVATLGTFLYLVAKNADASSLILSVLAGVIASGAALFFGRWIPLPLARPAAGDAGGASA